MRPSRARSVLGDDAGAITPMAAVMLTAVIGLAGLVTDVGVWYVQRRALQSATDAAAMAAANRPADATAIAETLLARNGFAAANLVSAEAGYYCPDASRAPADRFSTDPCDTGDETPASPNAVRLQTRTTGPALLSRVLGQGEAAIRTTAVATRIDEAGLTIRSGLADADVNTSNAVLQSLLGGSGLSLSAVQYDGLVSTNLSAQSFLQALAGELGVGAGTYAQLLATPARVGDVLQAEIDALNQEAGLADVGAAISGLQALKAKLTGDPTISLGQLFDLGVWRDQPVSGSGSPSALQAGLNVYQTASFALQLGGGSHAVAIPASQVGIPGLLGATLQATAIEPPQSAYFAFGPTGITVHTAQVRLLLTLNVAALSTLPVYVEVAQGDATLTDLACGPDPANDATATVEARTGVASLYLGAPPPGAMTNFSTPVAYADITPATLANVGVITVNGKAQASVTSSGPTTLTFSQPPEGGIPPGQTLSSQGYMARMATADGPAASDGWPAQVVANGLVGGALDWSRLDLSVCVLGACGSSGLPASVSTALQGLPGILDPLVDQVLQSLGVQLGTAEVLVSGVRCGVPVLIA